MSLELPRLGRRRDHPRVRGARWTRTDSRGMPEAGAVSQTSAGRTTVTMGMNGKS